uniref:DUF5641 domain-containing protein n=1 Tax=Wuchereria bancrofti TaxID=6293 RepID=A0AAF5Q7V3_WUCBA
MHVHGTLLNELDKLRQEPEVQAFLRSLNIEWKHSVPHALWARGLCERLISIFKIVFQMTTVAIEIEAIMNSRPLTVIDDENMQPLRPMDFLKPSVDSHSLDYLLNYWKEGVITADKFWEKWQMQYLQTLHCLGANRSSTQRMLASGAHHQVNSTSRTEHQSKQTVSSRGPEYRTRR